MTTKYFETKEQYINFRNAWAKAAQAKQLTAAHMILYNIIRGKDPQHGFTPFQRRSKYIGMGMLNHGAVMAYNDLCTMKKRASSNFGQKRVERFIAPLEGTFTTEDLLQIEIPKVETLWTGYGKGLRIAENIPDGFKAKTVEELLELDVEKVA